MKKMKKWKDKLIKALGGYTDQISMPQPVVKQYTKFPVRLGTAFTYSYCDAVPDSESRRKYMLEELAIKIGQSVVDGKLYELRMIDKIETPFRTEEHYEITVEIIPPGSWGQVNERSSNQF